MNKQLEFLKKYGNIWFVLTVILYYLTAEKSNFVMNVLIGTSIILIVINKIMRHIKRK